MVEDLAVYAHKTEEEIKQETATEVEPILDELKKVTFLHTLEGLSGTACRFRHLKIAKTFFLLH